ncbi:MAG: hypothetical protein NZM31_02325 [Gemmatales bacterium]|nr:hypothetical protein [Gemmatales bacterium]MDW8385834.1 hypothetical protein [Gemmatales bacterium]
MQIGVSGDHPEALAVAAALVQTGRHRLTAACCSPSTLEWLGRKGIPTVLVPDRDALFSNPEIDLLIVGDGLAERGDVLRRAVRSDKHVLCVHPTDLLPDVTYEAALVQEDTRKMLLPILWHRLHPGLKKLAQLTRSGSLGQMTLVEGEITVPETPASSALPSPLKPSKGRKRPEPVDLRWDGHPVLRVWEVLRFLAGEITEVSAVGAAGEQLVPTDTLTVTGRCQNGCLFRILIAPQPTGRDRVLIRGDKGEAVLTSERGFLGAAETTWRYESESGQVDWIWQPWPDFAEEVEKALTGQIPAVTWLDETRCLEVFDAVRQSVRRRRVIPLDYEEVSEGANFKTVMITLGCLTLLTVLVLCVVLLALGQPLAPWAFYLLLPLLLIFLALQVLGWAIPAASPKASASGKQPLVGESKVADDDAEAKPN